MLNINILTKKELTLRKTDCFKRDSFMKQKHNHNQQQ